MRVGKTKGSSIHPSYQGKVHGINTRTEGSKKVVTKGAFGNKNKKKQNKG